MNVLVSPLVQSAHGWNTHQVLAWIKERGLCVGNVYDSVEQNELTGSDLLLLIADDIRNELQISSLRARKALLEAIKTLKAELISVDERVASDSMRNEMVTHLAQGTTGHDDFDVAIKSALSDIDVLHSVLPDRALEHTYLETLPPKIINGEVADGLSHEFCALRVQEAADAEYAMSLTPQPQRAAVSSTEPPSLFSLAVKTCVQHGIDVASGITQRKSLAAALRVGSDKPTCDCSKGCTSGYSCLCHSALAADATASHALVNAGKQTCFLPPLPGHARDGMVKCVACMEPGARRFRLGCKDEHEMCTKCAMTLFSSASVDSSLLPLTCCGTPVKRQLEICKLVLPEKEAKRFLSLHDEHTATNTMYCPEPTCSKFINLDMLYSTTLPRFDCPECSLALCSSCCVVWHEGQTCAQHKSSGGPGGSDVVALALASEEG
ncbi:hypothetical protein T492DRAFT_833398 [Pavlovales sp. CCMP2436]|nr:hypothetical protein T492DRAFT_833398 [Pavlovales sp. CCMP2436]